MEYDNTNRGTLFVNDRKEQETHADFNGSINIEGVDYWLNSWKKVSSSGKHFMSLSVKPKNPAPAQQAPAQPAVDYNTEGLDSDCPF